MVMTQRVAHTIIDEVAIFRATNDPAKGKRLAKSVQEMSLLLYSAGYCPERGGCAA
eukprot:gene20377-7384_t